MLPEALAQLPREARPLVRHQAGEKLLQETIGFYHQYSVEAEIKAFEKDMAEAYGWADLVLCRAGALTVTELSTAGLGSILVPYPHAVDDHQTHNAQFLVDAGAAQLIQQSDLTAADLAGRLKSLCASRESLLVMAKAAREQARADATANLGRFCLETIES
jgi:UDP-N-acetylglucosamine--N-acetylmuramyl-(pentapeptide) pyrophosphoryl-undecaprenol N-acetylglucosamine transferase